MKKEQSNGSIEFPVQETGEHRQHKKNWPKPSGFVPPQKVRYSTTWFYYLMALCLVVAWMIPIVLLSARLLWPPAEVGVRDSYEFAALVYDNISDKPGGLKPWQFKRQLNALRENGYHPITLQDVAGLYQSNAPLPRKAVLLTFDHSKKNAYFGVRSILRRAGWNAVMFLWTQSIQEEDQASIWWPYVRDMVRSRRWEIGAQSHNGFSKVQTSSRGRMGNFMTTPRWMPEEKRFESLDEFTTRLSADHEECLSLIQQETGKTPMAYAYPYGDFGQFQSRAALPRYLNMSLVERYYQLGFITGKLAVNTRFSDPRRLNRLLVDSAWTGEELVSYLEKSWPMESPIVVDGNGLAEGAWIVDWGSMEPDHQGGLTLYAPTNTTGAKMWLAGSDLSRDFNASITFRLEEGQLGLYFRSTPDEERFVYLGIDIQQGAWLRQMAGVDGTEPDVNEPLVESGVWLRQKHVSSDRFTLASSSLRTEKNTSHTLDVYIRNNLLYALLDGLPLFSQRVVLRGSQNPGLLGLSVWSPQKGRARVNIQDVHLLNQPASLVFWQERSRREPHVFRWINDNAYRLTDISPEWLRLTEAGGQVRSEQDFSLYRLLADINHLHLYPCVFVDGSQGLPRLSPVHLAGKAEEMKADGLYINMSGMEEPNISSMALWLQQCRSELKTRGLHMLLSLPKALETVAAVNSILAVVPGVQLVVGEDSQLKNEKGVNSDQKIDAVEVPEEEDEELPLFYMISQVNAPESRETQADRIRRLEQSGWASYDENDFPKALQAWQEWLKEDPENPRALMLLGDVQLAMGHWPQALDFYNRSLKLDPGQFSLVIRRAEVLEKMGRLDEARDSLNLYARLFPGNSQILMAQIQWLLRNQRDDDAMELISQLLERQPDNLEAQAIRLRFMQSDTPAYREAMRQLALAGDKAMFPSDYGNILWRNELLSLPWSGILQRRVLSLFPEDDEGAVPAPFDRLLPTPGVERTDFAGGLLRDRWMISGGGYTGVPGKIRVQAAPGNGELSLQLRGSIHLQNVFTEADVRPVRGDCWLYARRNSRHAVRFGLSQKGVLHLQVWRDGIMLDQRTQPWMGGDDVVRLRLVVNAQGAMGYVDGRPVSDSRLFVPPEIQYGWCGAAVNDEERGTASADFLTLAAGPLPLRVAWMNPVPDVASFEKALEALRTSVDQFTVFAPQCFEAAGENLFRLRSDADMPLLRLFTSYYRVWFLPLVRLTSLDGVTAEILERQVKALGSDGFILLLDQPPEEEALTRLESGLAFSPVRILVAAMEGVSIRVRGLALGRDLVNTRSGDVLLPIGTPDQLEDAPGDPALQSPLAVVY